MHPLGINNQVSYFSGYSRSFFECSGEEFFACDVLEYSGIQSSASNHSNIAFTLGVREHPILWDRTVWRVRACLSCVMVREHPKLLWVRVITQAHLFLLG